MNCKFINSETENEMVFTRRELHKYPEEAFAEYKTTYMIVKRLTELGYKVTYGRELYENVEKWHNDEASDAAAAERAAYEGVPVDFLEKIKGGYTGAVAEMKFDKEGTLKLLRFDIDALKLDETTEKEHIPNKEGFRSCHTGLMHGCGHDGHTAAGLGIARAVAENKDCFSGRIRLLFQPAEEGAMGAKCMKKYVKDADFCIGAHIGICADKLGEIDVVSDFLATSKIDIEFFGRASHAGIAPEKGINALWAAAALTNAAYNIPRPDFGRTMINVGTLTGGTARNIIADYAYMQAETRGQSTELNEYMKNEFLSLAKNCEEIYGAKVKITVLGEAVSESTSAEMIPFAKKAAMDSGLGEKFCERKSFGASEDFSVLAKTVQENGGKSLYLAFGADIKGGHHTSGFDFDERVLKIFAENMCRTAGEI